MLGAVSSLVPPVLCVTAGEYLGMNEARRAMTVVKSSKLLESVYSILGADTPRES